jgi:outer membrane protein assembly factor BamD (BamD/ComL family)
MKTSPDMLFKQAYALHYKSDNSFEALKIYEEIISQYPESPEAGYAVTQTKILNENKLRLEERKQIEKNLLDKLELKEKLKVSGKL